MLYACRGKSFKTTRTKGSGRGVAVAKLYIHTNSTFYNNLRGGNDTNVRKTATPEKNETICRSHVYCEKVRRVAGFAFLSDFLRNFRRLEVHAPRVLQTGKAQNKSKRSVCTHKTGTSTHMHAN